MASTLDRPVLKKIFISYAQADELLCQQLQAHLAGMQRDGLIETWHNRMIHPGRDRRHEVDDRIQQADLILLLVSSDFMASNYCWEIEVEQALLRHHTGSVRLVPIIVRACDWQQSLFGSLQPLPQSGQSITSFSDRDKVWCDVVSAIRSELCTKNSNEHYEQKPIPPPGSRYDSDWYISRSSEEQNAFHHLMAVGTPAVLRGPELFGKSWLIQHLLTVIQQNKTIEDVSRVVFIDLRLFEREAFKTPDSFLLEMGRSMLRQLEASQDLLNEVWQLPLSSNYKFSLLIKEQILIKIIPRGLFVLAIDHVDELAGRNDVSKEVAERFSSLLRNFCDEARSQSGSQVQRLRMLLSIACSPTFLSRSINESWFNFVDDIHLNELTSAQIYALAARYQIQLSSEDQSLLSCQVGGHPYLIRRVIYQSALYRRSISDLLSGKITCNLFDDYLRRVRNRLIRVNLYEVAQRVADDANTELNYETYDLLYYAGIIVATSEQGRMRFKLRYPLYRRLFYP